MTIAFSRPRLPYQTMPILFCTLRRLLPFLALAVLCHGAHAADSSSRLVDIDNVACRALHDSGVMHANAPVRCDQLRIVRFSYIGFDGRQHDDGEIMVMAAAAEHVQSIFDSLLKRRFAIAGARLMNRYHGDDQASMRDNNTSAFNDRAVTGDSAPSLHAYGLAIDLNPVQNPFLQFGDDGKATFSPEAGSRYANRLQQRPGKTARKGMAEDVVTLFAENGFVIWGGDWDAPIDYQHFQTSRALAKRLAALSAAEGRAVFSAYVQRYRACMRNKASGNDRQTACIASAERTQP
jgi:hypothetical protein